MAEQKNAVTVKQLGSSLSSLAKTAERIDAEAAAKAKAHYTAPAATPTPSPKGAAK